MNEEWIDYIDELIDKLENFDADCYEDIGDTLDKFETLQNRE